MINTDSVLQPQWNFDGFATADEKYKVTQVNECAVDTSHRYSCDIRDLMYDFDDETNTLWIEWFVKDKNVDGVDSLIKEFRRCFYDTLKLDISIEFSINSDQFGDYYILTPQHTINKKYIKDTLKVLIDNGISQYKAQKVLQSIGYSLLNTELFSGAIN